MKRTYHGSCHCKAVTYEADLDLDQGTGKCNCTFCWKRRAWSAGHLGPDDFRLLSGEDVLADYGKSGEWGETHNRFCKTCGVATHGYGSIDAMGGAFFAVLLPTLARQRWRDGLRPRTWCTTPLLASGVAAGMSTATA